MVIMSSIRIFRARGHKLGLVLQEREHSSEPLGEILIRKKLITPKQLQEALSRQSNIPFDPLEGFSFDQESKGRLASIISQRYAEKNLILPVSLQNKELTLALLKPEKIETARELKQLYNHLSISCVLITEEKFSELFDVLYSRKLGGVRSAEEHESQGGDQQGVDFMQIELDEDMDAAEGDKAALIG